MPIQPDLRRTSIRSSSRQSISLILVMCFAANLLGALQIPVFAGFDSANRVDWHYERQEKSISWNETYLIRFGIDDLRRGPLGLDLGLETRANFIEEQVLLDYMRLSYTQGAHSVTLSSEPIGFGSGYIMQTLQPADPRYDAFLFGQTRFNGMGYAYRADDCSWGAALGGNAHNLMMATGNLELDIAAHKLRGAMRLETFDRHLRKPALSAGLGGDLDLTLLRLKTDTLWRMVVLLDDGTDQEIYHATQIILPITDSSELFAGINLETRDYFPRQNTEILLGARVTSGRLGFNPWLKLSRVEDDEVLMANLRVDWNFAPDKRIGIFIAHTNVKDGARHASLGIQNSFRFDF